MVDPGGDRSAGDARPNARPERVFKALSDDAKCVLGAHFGMMTTKGHVAFQTPWNRTPRGAAALAELVDAGFLTVKSGEHGLWAWTYRTTPGYDAMEAWKWCRRNTKKLAGLTMMVPSSSRSEAPPRDWNPLSFGSANAAREHTEEPSGRPTNPLSPTPSDGEGKRLGTFCNACQAIPSAGYCNLAGCPMPKPEQTP